MPIFLAHIFAAGIPLLVHDFLNRENEKGRIGVRQATLEWAAAGHGRFLGCFGCCALYVTQAIKS